jgi:hypothetical protein
MPSASRASAARQVSVTNLKTSGSPARKAAISLTFMAMHPKAVRSKGGIGSSVVGTTMRSKTFTILGPSG